MTATATKTEVSVAPFAVEADHPRNNDLLLQSIVNCRLRSRIMASRTVKDAKSGVERIPKDQSRHLGSLPEIPGMVLEVNPADLSYTVVDPLCDDEELCKRIQEGLKSEGNPIGEMPIKGVPPQKGKLDVHRMKTLCYELINIVNADEARIVDGPRPTAKAVDKLPGNELLNPGSRIHNGQPRFKKDYPEYLENLQKSGG